MRQNQLEKLGYKLESKDGKLYYGGYLDLRGTGITSLPDSLVVGGGLDLRGTGITDTSKVNRNTPSIYQWKNGKYIKADGIFSEVLSNRGNVYKIRQIGKSGVRFLVTDGNGKWSHGDTLKEAKADLIHKISNRDKSKYESLTTESELSFEECVEMYRVITGACSSGTRGYVENRLPKKKDSYKINEIIQLTENEYGGKTFADFFIQK